MGTRWNSRSMSNKPTVRSARCHIPLYLVYYVPSGLSEATYSRLEAANDLVPGSKSIARTHVPNHRFLAIR